MPLNKRTARAVVTRRTPFYFISTYYYKSDYYYYYDYRVYMYRFRINLSGRYVFEWGGKNE